MITVPASAPFKLVAAVAAPTTRDVATLTSAVAVAAPVTRTVDTERVLNPEHLND